MTSDDESLLDEATQATAEAEAANLPGVYVYSFPAVLGDEQQGLVRLKVGKRAEAQRTVYSGSNQPLPGGRSHPSCCRVYSQASE